MNDQNRFVQDHESHWKKDNSLFHTQYELNLHNNSAPTLPIQLDILEREDKINRDEVELRYRASRVGLADDVETYINSRFINPLNEKLPAFEMQLIYLVTRGYRDVGISAEKPEFIKVTKRHIGLIGDKTNVPKDAVSVGLRTILMEGLEKSFSIEYDPKLKEGILTKNKINEFSFSLKNNPVSTSRFYALCDFSPSSPIEKIENKVMGKPRLEIYLGLNALNALENLSAHHYLSLRCHLGDKFLPLNVQIKNKDGKERLDYMIALTESRRGSNYNELTRMLKIGLARGYHLDEESFVNLPDGIGNFRANVSRYVRALSNSCQINISS